MSEKLNIDVAKELLKVKSDGILYHRESQNLEFKESFSLAGLADYFRDFAAFANNKGGYLVFGVKDRPKRELLGLRIKAAQRFDDLDPELISSHLLNCFANKIDWEYEMYKIDRKKYGFFYIYEAPIKPIITKADKGKDLKNGDIYYRYGGRTQTIQHAELESIINKRVEQNNQQWIDLVQKIGSAGPQNAAILDTEQGLISKKDSQILVVGEELIKDIKWIREGDFTEKKGAKTLKLVGEVKSIDQIEVIRKVKENKLKEYPFSSTEVWKEVSKQSSIKQNEFYRIIKENNLRSNPEYCSYVFRNMKQQEDYEKNGNLSSSVPCIYKPSVVGFILQVFNNEKKKQV
uniref:ATP-binding protein n=1 Tax=Gelidibacter sp. TaxID=2018083 RepID=UPI00404B341B